jgi:hypothetical protein
MSNVVQFLESLACNPGTLSAEQLASAIADSDLEPAVREALLNRDAEALNAAVGGRSTVLCFVAPAENDEPQEEEPQEGEPESPEQETSMAA